MSLKLNIGAGDTVIEGYTPVDRKFGQEAYPLDYPDNSVDAIRASHVLEHFGWAEIGPVLKDWTRVLKPGGEIKIAVPDFAKAVMMGQEQQDDKWPYYIMGGQTDENDFHKSIWTEASLRTLMESAGLADIAPWESKNTDTACLPVSLNLRGVKPGSAAVSTPQQSSYQLPPLNTNIRAVFSMPRLGFADNFFTAQKVFVQRGIDIMKYTGVFWDQCMERLMVDNINEGYEYVVTLDYDTLFDGETFDEMYRIMRENPHIDALAPLQMKREEDRPMVWDVDRDGKPKSDFNLAGETTRIRHAHFGLTIIRLESLKKMQHPWFQGQPDEVGQWGDGRMDPDIYFWEKMATYDLQLHLANHCSIGHLQLIATWPKKNNDGMAYQYANDFMANGKPAEAW